MWNLLVTGGLVFSLPLLVLLLAIVGLSGWSASKVFSGAPAGDLERKLSLVLHLGVFSAVWGVLGQAIGLYDAMKVIESVGGVSPALLAGGLKVSFIVTIFGLMNLTIAFASWTWLRLRGFSMTTLLPGYGPAVAEEAAGRPGVG